MVVAAACLLVCSCNSGAKEADRQPLPAPSGITVERDGTMAAAIVSWTDNSEGESGFSVFRCQDMADEPERIGFTVENATSFTAVKDLVPGESYYFGVRADGNDRSGDDSEISWSGLWQLEDLDAPKVSIADIRSTDVSVTVEFGIENLDKAVSPVCGVCWNLLGEPVAEDDHQDCLMAEPLSEDGMLVISNAMLDYGREYWFRAYVKSDGKVYYSEEGRASLGQEPEPVTLNWTRISIDELPSSVAVYYTEDKLGGDPFKAWYAIADLSQGDVELKVLMPESLQTIDEQAGNASGCCVLTNAGYFYGTSHVGVAVLNSVTQGYIPDMRGSLRSDAAEYNELYHATRGIFGVGTDGTPGVFWIGGAKNMYYDRPLPSVCGERKLAACSESFPSANIDWRPKFAVSGGPVLLYDGKCPFDFTCTEKGGEHYLNNFEMIPYDIFGPDVTPDRTAVGYTEDGKVILFVCDGRTSVSGGATLTELAMLMKGLGCVAALNLDGGGSTGMMVGTDHVNDSVTGGNRKVKSTIGFFRK